jgi:hypothetical protein
MDIQKMRLWRTDEMPIRAFRKAQDVQLLSEQYVNSTKKTPTSSKRDRCERSEKRMALYLA